MAETVLLIAHSHSREGRIAPLLESKGYAVEWMCPAHGDRLPDGGDGYAGIIAFGGVQSVNDAPTTAFIREEIDWIRECVHANRRFLGICLGSQLLASALGARVAPHPAGMMEIGYYPIAPTEAGRGLITDPLYVYHWHREGFEVPEGAVLLARGRTFPNQAFRFGRFAYGLQFHPEVTPEVARRWLDVAADDLVHPGAHPRENQLADSQAYDSPLHSWMDGFLDHWLGRVRAEPVEEAEEGAYLRAAAK